MRTSEERQRLIHKRITEIQKEEQRKRQDMISVAGIVACLVLIVGLGCWLPGVTRQASGDGIDYTIGVASMLGQHEALGYICMGVLAFALGVCVTVFLYRLRSAQEHRKNEEEYRYQQGQLKDRQEKDTQVENEHHKEREAVQADEINRSKEGMPGGEDR